MTTIYADSSLTEACYVIEGEEPCFTPYLDPVTNNWGEYTAVLLALRAAHERELTGGVVKTDSELVVKQVNGEYVRRNGALRALAWAVEHWLELTGFRLEWVSREENPAGRALEKRRHP